MHEDEEIRYILSGSGFLDIREHPSDEWIRIHVLPGDLLVIPAGIYHRFTLDESNQVKALRLFKEEPKWTPYVRSPETDSNAYHVQYINSLKDAAVIDTECDHLERACGRAPKALLRIRDDPLPSSPHQPRGDGPPPTLAPKWSHWTLVLCTKHAHDYVEATQIEKLYHRDIEEHTRRE
ncbi:ARD/ARD' family-domain-containing protein [Lactifluus subvellereus]|nr:ARD/ARD' family-domain-containing protein [Lactifluus subvellereus]